MRLTPCSVTFRAFVCLAVVLFFSSSSQASEHAWDSIVSTVHQVAEIVRKGEKAEPYRLSRAKSDLDTLLESPETITSFLEFAYGRGLLHLDGFRNDLLFIHSQIAGPNSAKVVEQLKELGFAKLAIHFAEIPKRDSNLTDADIDRGGEPRSDDAPSEFTLPGHERGATIEDRAWKTLAELEADYSAGAAKLDAFVQAGEAWEKRIWMGTTVAVIGAAAWALVEGFEMLEIGQMRPKELIALMGGIWAANAGTFYLVWNYTGWLEAIKPLVERTKYTEVKEAWKNLMGALPALAARTTSAAAQDKLENPATKMDAYSMAALEALLETNTSWSTEELFTRALQYLQNGHLKLAKRVFREIDRRTPQEQLRNLTLAVDTAFKAKSSLENRVFYRQFGSMILKLTGVGLAIWAANQGVKAVMPEWIRIWATVPSSVAAALGLNRVLKFFWKPQKRERVEGYTVKQREKLLNAFRLLMKADPTGEVLRRIAANHSSSATQEIVTETAVDAMAEVNSGRATLEMYRMWRDALSTQQENGKRVQHMIKKTFENHRGCLRELVNVTSTLGESLRTQTANVATARVAETATTAAEPPPVTAVPMPDPEPKEIPSPPPGLVSPPTVP